MTIPPGEGGPRPEDVGEGQEQRPETPTVEDLKQQRVDLEARFAEIKAQKAAKVTKQVGDREAMVAEDRRLVSMLAEAQKTLTFFEAQEQGGLLTDPKDQEDLRLLKELIISLQQQREESLQKYDAIMGIPEVKDEVLKDAYVEHGERGLRKEVEQLNVELEKKADAIYLRMEALVPKSMQAREEQAEAEQRASHARERLREVIDQTRRSFRTVEDMTRVLESFDQPMFLERLAEKRKKLGLFASKDKAAIDYVIVQNREIVVQNEVALADLEKARKERDDLIKEMDSLEAEYGVLIADEFYARGELVTKVARGEKENAVITRESSVIIGNLRGINTRVRDRVEQFANLERYEQGTKGMVGKYKGWDDAFQEPKNKTMYSLWNRLHDKEHAVLSELERIERKR
ncbi:MAG: hypothetical protein AAB351_00930 [Patescibacteria group bacterium]